MIIRMENAEGLSLAQMQAIVHASEEVRFAGGQRKEVYEWVQRALVQGEYARQGRQARGVVRAYLCKMTGKSVPQITRLIRQYRQTGGGAGRSLSAAALRAGVHGGGRAVAGAGGPGARAVERAGYAAHSGAGIRSLRADGICAPGRDIGSASLQSAKETGLSESGGLSREHPHGGGLHWGTAPARPAREPRISAGGYRASGGLGGPQGSVPSQLRGRGQAMGSGGVCDENQ